MQDCLKTWHVLGAGAVGCLWACRLSQAGLRPRLLLSPRSERRLAGQDKRRIHLQEDVAGSLESLGEFAIPIASREENISRVLLATKANDALDAVLGIQAGLSNKPQIITLGNGMGYHEDIANHLPQAELYAVSTTDGVYFKDEQQLVLAGRGQSKLARIDTNSDTGRANLQALSQALSVPGHRLQVRHNAQRMLLDKLLINACINGLTAIHQCRNGGLLEDQQPRQQLELLIAECQSIAVAARQTVLAKSLPKRVRQVINNTARNYSSTYTDIAKGRRSEIDYLNGYLVRLGTQLGVATPQNEAICLAITELEARAN